MYKYIYIHTDILYTSYIILDFQASIILAVQTIAQAEIRCLGEADKELQTTVQVGLWKATILWEFYRG